MRPPNYDLWILNFSERCLGVCHYFEAISYLGREDGSHFLVFLMGFPQKKHGVKDLDQALPMSFFHTYYKLVMGGMVSVVTRTKRFGVYEMGGGGRYCT